jgi:hypothetical protein
MLRAMAGMEILEVVNHRNPLGLGSPEKVILDRIRAAETSVPILENAEKQQALLVSKGDLDWAFESMGIPIL